MGALYFPRAYAALLRALVTVALVLGTLALTALTSAFAAPNYYKAITIDRTKVGTSGAPATLTNFAVLYSVIDPTLKTTAYGGHVANANGYDITFRAPDGVTQLDHEIERYVASTGELVAWVRVPTLNTISSGSNTTIYVYYGDSSVVTPTADPNGVWDSNYKGVWHLNESVYDETYSGTLYDSTANGNNGAQGRNNDATGKIAKGQDFDNYGDYIRVPNSASLQPTTAITISGWIRLRTFGSGAEVDPILRKGQSGVVNYELAIHNGRASLYINEDDDPYATVGGSTALAANTWYYVVGTFQGNSGGTTARVYLNGVQDGSSALNATIGTDTRPVFIGGRDDGNDVADGTIDEVRISNVVRSSHWIKAEYNNQSSPSTFFSVGPEQTPPPPVSRFNVIEPGANATSGKIFTKVAGSNLALDIVALDTLNAIVTTFTGIVAVEVVDNSSGGACSGLPAIATLTNQTFALADLGRRALSGTNTVANVYRDAKVRVKFPATSPTVIACSGDNFAIRPNTLTLAVQDANRTTAGTSRTLNATTISGTTVHNAGRPFTITATAYNAAGTPAVTSNYDGAPTAVLSACASDACTSSLGTFSVGTWAAGGGTLVSTTGSYGDVGAFSLQLQDAAFAAVDAADGSTAAQRTITSSILGVGRFVPDAFVLSATSMKPRTDIAACSSSNFTYMSERMDALFTLTAVAYPSGTTLGYTGTLARLALTSPASFNFGAIDGGAATQLTSRLNTALGSSGTWTNGVANVTAVISLNRNAAPDGPYNSFALGVAPADPDGVTLGSAALNLDADNNGTNERARIGAATRLRFGRLRLQNAVGSQLIAMPIPVEAQYWNGSGFVTNTDDSCTTFALANVTLGNYQKSLSSGETTVSTSGTVSAGVGSLRLTAPGAANGGSVDVSLNLGTTAAGASCTASMPASTPVDRSYLRGAWCSGTYDRDPTARATFGLLRTPRSVIFTRENY